MIVRMSKIEVVGLRQDLEAVLETLWQDGHLHIDPSTVGFVDEKERGAIHSLLPDEKTVFEKLFLTDLRDKLDTLLGLLPNVKVRQSHFSPALLLDSISARIDGHLAQCAELDRRRAALVAEREGLGRYRALFAQLEGLLADLEKAPDLEYIGLSFEGQGGERLVRKALDTLIGDAYELFIDRQGDLGSCGLLVVEKSLAGQVRSRLAEKKVPELSLPGLDPELPFAGRLRLLAGREAALDQELADCVRQLEAFAGRWGPLYLASREWIKQRLSLLQASGMVFESTLCFFVYGWIPAADVEALRGVLAERFLGRVHLEVLAIRRSDTSRVPVLLKNPPLLRPFENFTRLLPLPAYSSYDPTPFIAFFFPLFFGMILGDAGYGLLLLLLGLLLQKKAGHRSRLLADAGAVLRFASLYAILFGLLYAEFFGDLPARFFNLHPILDRHTKILPLLYFALAVGGVHVLFGLGLGVVAAWRGQEHRKALAKGLHILLLFCAAFLVIASVGGHPELRSRPVLVAVAVLCPALLFTGGLLAPLELLKDFGNIVSYARIMAIGLTSVLLAYVANRLAGATGDVFLGLLVGALIHLMNMVIGVFSSTIHSIRLHYVEFFDKFLEFGGRHYQPLHKEDTANTSESGGTT